MIKVGQQRLSANDFEKILYAGEKIELDGAALDKVERNFQFLQTYSQHKIIYGINTGLGPMAQYKISDDDQRQLQYNLIRSHSSGAGQPIADDLSRSTMLARLNSLMQAASGVHPTTVTLLRDLLNNNISACIFERGGVGASGDLVQLAHLALNLIGEGEMWHNGSWRPAKEVYQSANLQPLEVHLREGLALMNGTSRGCKFAD